MVVPVVHSVVHPFCNPVVLSSVVLHPVVLPSEVVPVVVPVAPSSATAQSYKCEGPKFANVPRLLESLTGLIQPFCPTVVYPLPSGGDVGFECTYEYNQNGFG